MSNASFLTNNLNLSKQILFRDATDFSSDQPATATNSLIVAGANTPVQLDFTAILTTAARCSSIADFGANRAPSYRMDCFVDWTSVGAPAAGGTIDCYWAGTNSSTGGTGTPIDVPTADADITPDDNQLGTFQRIGSLPLQNVVINGGYVGILVPHFRYGQLIVVNNGSTTTDAAMDETYFLLTPMHFEN